MVLNGLASAIPNPFGGFAPFPNSIMIPFMSAQSQALAYGFGIDYEYGKRTIRSMSNAEFNSLTPSDVTNLVNARLNEVLTQLHSQLPAFTAFQSEIIDKQVEVEVAKANRTPSAMAEIITALLSGGHEATAQAIEQYVGSAENKDVALQTLSLISPIFALMGLANAEGGTTPPAPSTGNLYQTRIDLIDPERGTTRLVLFEPTIEYTYDASQAETLKTQLNDIMIAEGNKYGGRWFNQPLSFFNGLNSTDTTLQEIKSAEKFVIALMKWHIIDGTPLSL